MEMMYVYLEFLEFGLNIELTGTVARLFGIESCTRSLVTSSGSDADSTRCWMQTTVRKSVLNCSTEAVDQVRGR